MKKAVILILVIALGVMGVVFGGRMRRPLAGGGQVQVTASFYPVGYLAQRIGGERVEVVNITPAGAEPHDWEPTTTDIARMENSRLVILNGAGLELWEKNVKDILKNKTAEVVTLSDNLARLEVVEGGKSIRDPHTWLDPILYQQMADRLLWAYVTADPGHKNEYEDNAANLAEDLARLDSEFAAGLRECRQKNIVTSHTAFGYLAARYGLKQMPISGVSPEEEPSPRTIAGLADFAKRNQVRYIFFETLVSPKLAQTLAYEVGAQTLVFNPLEGLTEEELAAGEDYLSVQRANLAALQTALECK